MGQNQNQDQEPSVEQRYHALIERINPLVTPNPHAYDGTEPRIPIGEVKENWAVAPVLLGKMTGSKGPITLMGKLQNADHPQSPLFDFHITVLTSETLPASRRLSAWVGVGETAKPFPLTAENMLQILEQAVDLAEGEGVDTSVQES